MHLVDCSFQGRNNIVTITTPPFMNALKSEPAQVH